jgi:hypothetical protein
MQTDGNIERGVQLTVDTKVVPNGITHDAQAL